MILKLLNSNQKNFIQKLELILKKRKVNRSSKSLLVKKIISDVIKNKDQALIKYENKFSKFNKIGKKNIKF